MLATLKGRLEGRYAMLYTFAGWTMESCGQLSNRRMSNTSRDSSAGSGDAEADITVTSGRTARTSSPRQRPRSRCRITGRLDGELEVFRSGGQGCVVATQGDTRPHVPSDRTAGGLIQVNGRVDPKTPNTLSGSTEDVSPSSSSGSSSKCVKTTTWNFQRQ